MESLVQLLFQVSSRGLPKIWYPFSFVDTKARKNGGKDFRSSYKSCCERAIIKCRLKDLHLCIQNKILQSLKGDRLKKNTKMPWGHHILSTFFWIQNLKSNGDRLSLV